MDSRQDGPRIVVMAQSNLSVVAEYSRDKRNVFEHRDSGAFRRVVGEAAVSGILCQREDRSGLLRLSGKAFDSKQLSNFAFAKRPVSVRI
jgi:hypothetical protein